MGSEKNRLLLVAAIFAVLSAASIAYLRAHPPVRSAYHGRSAGGKAKLIWFIPDGLRADPGVFTIFRWAEEGKLPNLKRMMERGSYGYSIPAFPSHTPVNYATLLTGLSPLHHGVADGPMRLQGYPLNMISLSGFHSTAKAADPVWITLEKAGLASTLLSVPGSTPPETSESQVIRGRWGGWGVEFPSVVFHSWADEKLRAGIGWNDRVFGVEKKLTEFVKAADPSGWKAPLPRSFSPPREVSLRNWGADLFLLLLDTTDDHRENYDRAVVSADKRVTIATLGAGEWSGWFPVSLRYEIARQFQKDAPARLGAEEALSAIAFETSARVAVIRLGGRDEFRVRVLYDALNESLALPRSLSAELHAAAGPMVDFVDNYPPQLVYEPEDKAIFAAESEQSFDWHRRAAKALLGGLGLDVFIHSIYSPNQMLTSRWWMGAIDPRSFRYASTPERERSKAWEEVLAMYRRVDEMLGDALDSLGPEAYLVFSSDHGVAALNQEVRLNNLFAAKGWLRIAFDPSGGRHEIDWKRTRVAYLNMNHVYVNPDGLAGPYRVAAGAAYEKLRGEVLGAVQELRNEKGEKPLAGALFREEASAWGLPGERVGDIVLANSPGFSWAEEVSEDKLIFAQSVRGGYKQAIPPNDQALWTPFVIVGPGVKAGNALSKPVAHMDQLPTILKLMKVSAPYKMDGEVIGEALSR